MKIYFVKTNAYNDVCFDYPEEQKCYMLNPKNGYVDGNKNLDLYSDNIIDKLEAYYKSLISEDALDPNGEYYDYSDEGRDNFFANMELHEIITDCDSCPDTADVTRNLSKVSDEFICEKCGVHLDIEDCTERVYNKDNKDTYYYYVYEFKFCPECGRRIVEQ